MSTIQVKLEPVYEQWTSFREIWENERKGNRKLIFYNSVKEGFVCEQYLNIGLSFPEQKRLAQFRMSSHKYRIETGRHGHKRGSVTNRICVYCSADLETMDHLSAMPYFDPIIEDENHVLFECPQYEEERLLLNKIQKDAVKSLDDFKRSLTCADGIRRMARFLNRCHKRRFPEDGCTERTINNSNSKKKLPRKTKEKNEGRPDQ